MLIQFKNHIQKQFPMLKDMKTLVATSGGLDSMVLVCLLHKLKFPIAIAHCNFQLRGKESDEDADFVEQFAKENEIPFFKTTFQTEEYAFKNKLSIQLAARKLRYDWFNEVLKNENYQYTSTAHHLDDQVETFLINFTRGTGLDGLTGIPSENEKIVRPLLPFSREEIENYAKENKILWREDSSNASDKYFRNMLRHDVVPVLKNLNSTFLESFQNTLHYLNQANGLIDDASKMVFEKVASKLDDRIEIEISKLIEFQNYKSYLYQWLNEFGFTAWDDIYDLINAQTGKQVFSETHRILKNRNFLVVYPKTISTNNEAYFLNEIEKSLKVPLNISLCKVDNIFDTNNNIIFVDADKIKLPLVIRKKLEGDFFYPSGMSGKKKVSKYFKDEKFSIVDKQNQWLLVSNNEIIWIIGRRADERFLANTTTKNILKIEITE